MINAKNDIVSHYGFSSVVEIDDISNGTVTSEETIDISCAHKNVTFVDLGTNHSGICADFGVKFTACHFFNDEGICRYCSHSEANFGTIVINKSNTEKEMTQNCTCNQNDFIVSISDAEVFNDKHG